MKRLFPVILALILCVGAFAQGPSEKTSKTATKPTKSASNAPAQPVDQEYTDSIIKNTTDKMFLTEFVDHLPSSATVPSPAKILGYPIGTPNKLTYTADQYRYYRELEKASPRVKTFLAPEKSEEGRDQMLVVVGSEENLAKLARYKEITGKLADPRKLDDAGAQQLINEGKVFYWASGSIHSTETGSPEMLMELAYRLAVDESPFIQAIRKNVIVMITPTLEVDGRDMMVDLYKYRKANEGKRAPGLIYWGKYVAHDNNRDSLGMALALSRNQMATFLEYHPTVLHDLHESVPFLYTSTGTGPYNAWLDPIVVDEWQSMAITRSRK
jgi:Zinc carboxypeptidase.